MLVTDMKNVTEVNVDKCLEEIVNRCYKKTETKLGAVKNFLLALRTLKNEETSS